MKAIISNLVALALVAQGILGAADFFGVPEKTVVPKPAATPAAQPGRDPATPQPITSGPLSDTPPTLLPDGPQLRTPAVGVARPDGRPFRDLGPEQGVLIGFEYTVSTSATGATAIDSLTPFYLRAAGKARGVLRGTAKPGNPATVLEARPGFAVAAVEACGTGGLEAFRITFMGYENGALDPAQRYTTKWIGSPGTEAPKLLRTDTRPIVGIYGKAGGNLQEFGLLVRAQALAARPATPPAGEFFGTRPAAVPALPPVASGVPPLPAAPVAGGVQVFASADDEFALFLNGRQILAGTNLREAEQGIFPMVKGDVLAVVVKDKGPAVGGSEAWLSVRVVRDGKTILDAGDFQYHTAELPSWKMSRLMTGFRAPRIWTHEKALGSENRVRAAWATGKDATATTVYFKALVP